jgi:hypothetical protein
VERRGEGEGQRERRGRGGEREGIEKKREKWNTLVRILYKGSGQSTAFFFNTFSTNNTSSLFVLQTGCAFSPIP